MNAMTAVNAIIALTANPGANPRIWRGGGAKPAIWKSPAGSGAEPRYIAVWMVKAVIAVNVVNVVNSLR